MDFYRNLSLRFEKLTKQNKKLAEFVMDHPDQVISMTAKALGEASGTSAAAVVRMCQQLGYDSLEQMKIDIARAMSDEELQEPIDLMVSSSDTVGDIVKKLSYSQVSALEETAALLGLEDIRRAVDLLQKAGRVYLFGIGSSGLAAQELCHRLNRIGKPCIFLLDGHTALEYSAVASADDLLICFSYSGETKEVYLAARQAQKRGVPVIAVTRTRTSTLSRCASIVIRIPEMEKRVRIAAVSSITSQMFIIDVLYMCLVQMNFEQYEKILVDTSRVVNHLRE